MDYKNYIIAALSIAVAILLILLAGGFKIDFGDWKKALPRMGDLATSPAARELSKNSEEDAGADDPIVPEQENGQIAYIDSATTSEDGSAREVAATAPLIATSVPETPSTASDSEQADMIIIPKIGVSTSLIIPSEGTDAVYLKKLLDDGAVLYPDSPRFGQRGQTVVLGHSAPDGWPKIKHDTIFSRLAELEEGDQIIVVYNDKTYSYSIKQSEIVEKGADIPALAGADSALALVTCWPPGRDIKRIIVQAALDSVD